MSDPLADMIALLRPGAPFSKLANAAGAWRVRRAEAGLVYYSVVLAGSARLEVDGKPPVTLEEGDFVLVPAAYGFTVSSVDPAPAGDMESSPIFLPDGTVRLGRADGPVEVQQLVGHCTFGSPDAALLVPLLPDLIVVRGGDRLGTLAKLLRDEARADRPAREVILEHLLQVLLIETLRSSAATKAAPGLVRGLADDRLAVALRCIHADPARSWTVAELARAAGLSRSAFFTRFNRAVGVAPMTYLLTWRMSLAKDLLRTGRCGAAEIAARVGYGSASAFSVAFSRHVGQPPARYAQEMAGALPT